MDISWVKLSTDIFTNRKIKKIRKMEGGESIFALWMYLLCRAGACNDGGRVYFTERIPYDTETLADELDIDEDTVQRGLDAFSRFGMIEIDDDGMIWISAWEEYQNVDKMEQVREYNRNAQREYRARKRAQKATSEAVNLDGQKNVNDISMTQGQNVNDCQGTEKEIDIEGDKRRKENKKRKEEKFAEGSKPMMAAQYLSKKICERLPTIEPHDNKTLQRWAGSFDKCNRIDKHTWEEISLVLRFSQTDEFWQKNILSGDSFRAKYVNMLSKMNPTSSNATNNTDSHSQIVEYPKHSGNYLPYERFLEYSAKEDALGNPTYLPFVPIPPDFTWSRGESIPEAYIPIYREAIKEGSHGRRKSGSA